MNMKSAFQQVWKNRKKIVEGIWNTWFPTAYVEKIAKRRRELCESNVCTLYDKNGEKPNAFVPGKPSCGGCGCRVEYKTRSLSSYCYLKDIDIKPLWEAVMTEKEEKKFREKTGVKNE